MWIVVFIGIMGAIFGSFAACQAWRMRYKELGKKNPGKFSVCLACGEKLKWYDNIPIVSWLVLRGRCRKCHEKIGLMEILSEVGLAVVFVLLGIKFVHNGMLVMEIMKLIMLLVTICGMWFLLLYDAKWGELPGKILWLVVILAAIYAVLNQAVWWQTLMAIGILAGTYYLLYMFSHEKLVGSGDWILCLAVALVLGNWWLALLELFLSNLLASLMALPRFFKKHDGKIRKTQVHFGPFLVVAMVIILVLERFLLKALAF